jgi:hypothetical protein
MKILAIIGMTLAASVLPALRTHINQPNYNAVAAADSVDIREQINRTIRLSPGADVRIRGINGSVTIETLEGAGAAELDITITASDRDALARRPLLIDEGDNSLTIRTENNNESNRRGEWVRHTVRLRLPRSVSLNVSSVNGGLEVGAITGGVKISSINGRVKVEQAASATEISSINGGLLIGLEQLSSAGLRVSSINGGAEIKLGGAVNAEIEVRSVNGSINSEFPLTVVGEVKRGELRGTLGSGGAMISITSVNGGVNLRRL